jgi:hypothetical protein
LLSAAMWGLPISFSIQLLLGSLIGEQGLQVCDSY